MRVIPVCCAVLQLAACLPSVDAALRLRSLASALEPGSGAAKAFTVGPPARYAYAATRQRQGGGAMLNVLDFGAVGDGVTDCAPAIQQAINQAQREYRALYVPAGIFRIESGLVVNTTAHSPAKYSASTPHFRVAPLRLIGEGATNGMGQSVIFAAKPMAAVLTYDSRQPGSGAAMQPPGNLTYNHALQQITLDANDLANFSVFAPAIVGSTWNSVSFVHGLVAGLYIGYGWIHNIESCAFKGNGVANLYLPGEPPLTHRI